MFTRRYRVAAYRVVISSEDAAVSDAVRDVVGHLHMASGGRPAPSDPLGAELTLRARAADAGPVAFPDGARRIGERAQAWEAGPHLVLSDGRSLCALSPATGRGRIELHPSLLGDALGLRLWLGEFLLLSLLLLLRHRSLFPIHAAAVCRGPEGLLLAADTDHGKSTLTYSLVRQGWSYLSDDALLLDGAGAAVRAHALRRTFGLDVEAERYFSELTHRTRLSRFEGQEKYAVDVERLFPAQAVAACVPGVLVLPALADADESRLEPVDRVTALYELVRQSDLLNVEPAVAARQLDTLKRLVAQTRHYRLLGGRDIVEQPGRAAELLGPLLQPGAAPASFRTA